MPRFGRMLTAMITPFDGSGALDLDGAAEVARWLVEQGNEGLVVTGTTGESPTLTHAEDHLLWRTVTEVVDVPVLVGAGNNDTASSVERAKLAAECGAAGVLAVTPYYNRPSQEGLFRHFAELAAATTLPVMLYDIPFRTGRKLATETILRLAEEVPNVVAVKDAAGDVAETASLVARAPDGFEVYSGEDVLNLPLLAVGAVGVVSVAGHWAAAEIRACIEAYERGDVAEALRLDQLLRESYQFESGDLNPNPVPSKAMLRTLGMPAGECRLPMGPTPPGLEDRAREVYARLKSG